ncbi:hypothetical protein KSS87_019547 [Heliosperma pusillum]|nr:hypothetical protein KSS87_019547 [Heliosperma pusillum]
MVDEVERKRKKRNNMDGLADELLMEVLCRLPSSKTAIMCSSVCKRWSAIVSQPYFVSRFVNRKASCRKITTCPSDNGASSKYDQLRIKMMNDRTFGLVFRKRWRDTWKGLIIVFNDPISDPQNVTVRRLPRLVKGGLPPFLTVVGACNDLVLYNMHKGNKFELYIRNLQTGQCLALPSLHIQRITSYTGLICDPYYFSNTSTLGPNDAYHYRVVVIPYTSESVCELSAHLFSNNNGGIWHNVVLSLPITCQLITTCSLFYIGRKLYFCCVGGLISFDPFVDVNGATSSYVIKCHSLPLPPSLVTSGSFFGVFHEQLYMCDREDVGRYRVWVLEEDKTGPWWSLRHNIMGYDWIPCGLHMSELVNNTPFFGKAIGFHPATPDVIYVLFHRWIVLCNFSTRKVEIIYKVPKGCKGLNLSGGSFSLALPVWPTPLSSS